MHIDRERTLAFITVGAATTAIVMFVIVLALRHPDLPVTVAAFTADTVRAVWVPISTFLYQVVWAPVYGIVAA